jgi:hypothetical protein
VTVVEFLELAVKRAEFGGDVREDTWVLAEQTEPPDLGLDVRGEAIGRGRGV